MNEEQEALLAVAQVSNGGCEYYGEMRARYAESLFIKFYDANDLYYFVAWLRTEEEKEGITR